MTNQGTPQERAREIEARVTGNEPLSDAALRVIDLMHASGATPGENYRVGVYDGALTALTADAALHPRDPYCTYPDGACTCPEERPVRSAAPVDVEALVDELAVAAREEMSKGFYASPGDPSGIRAKGSAVARAALAVLVEKGALRHG
jgi:hypothetical protein